MASGEIPTVNSLEVIILSASQIEKLFKSSIIKGASVVAGGTALAQVITLLTTPIITRLYGPEIFGVASTLLSILTIIAPAAALSYPIAIVIAENEREALDLVWLSFFFALITSFFALIILLIFHLELVSLLNFEKYPLILWLLPLGMIASVAMSISNQWAVRSKLFKLKAKATVLTSGFQSAAKISIGYLYASAVALSSISIAALVLNALIMCLGFNAYKKKPKNTVKYEYIRFRKDVLRKYYDFALFRTPQNLLNGVSLGLPITILTISFSPSVGGQYALAFLIMTTPINLVGSSIGTVFYPYYADLVKSRKSSSPLLIKATLTLLLLTLPVFVVIFIYSPVLFSFIFGSEWSLAGEFARWLSIYSLFSLCAKPCVSAIPVLRVQGMYLSLEVVGTIIRIVALLAGYFIFANVITAVIMYSITSALHYLLVSFLALAKSKRLDVKHLDYKNA